MAEEKFSDNLLRVFAAELRRLNGMTAAREMFGKSDFALGNSMTPAMIIAGAESPFRELPPSSTR